MIRISIFDDNDSLRETLALVFDATDDLLVTGKYPNALNAVDDADTHTPARSPPCNKPVKEAPALQ